MYLIVPDSNFASKLVQHEVDEAPDSLDVPILRPTNCVSSSHWRTV